MPCVPFALAPPRERAIDPRLVSRTVGVPETNERFRLVVVLLVAVLVDLGVRVYDLHDSDAYAVGGPPRARRRFRSGTFRARSERRSSTTSPGSSSRSQSASRWATIGSSCARYSTRRRSCSRSCGRSRPSPSSRPVFLFFDIGTPMIRFVIVYAAAWVDPREHAVRRPRSRSHAPRCREHIGRRACWRLARVTLPAALPSIVGLDQVGTDRAPVGVTAEYLTLTGGIGAHLQQKQNAGELPEMYAAVVLIAPFWAATINVVFRATGAARRLLGRGGAGRVALRSTLERVGRRFLGVVVFVGVLVICVGLRRAGSFLDAPGERRAGRRLARLAHQGLSRGRGGEPGGGSPSIRDRRGSWNSAIGPHGSPLAVRRARAARRAYARDSADRDPTSDTARPSPVSMLITPGVGLPARACAWCSAPPTVGSGSASTPRCCPSGLRPSAGYRRWP